MIVHQILVSSFQLLVDLAVPVGVDVQLAPEQRQARSLRCSSRAGRSTKQNAIDVTQEALELLLVWRAQHEDAWFAKGDRAFVGDPPQEEQGLYGVFDADVTTIAVIKAHAAEIKSLSQSEGDSYS